MRICLATMITASIMALVVFPAGGYAQELLWMTHNDRTKEHIKQQNYSEAMRVANEALMVAEKTFGKEDPRVADSLMLLSFLYERQGEYLVAEQLNKRSLVIYEKKFGKMHPMIEEPLHRLSLTEVNLRDYSAAEQLYKRLVDITEKKYGEKSIKVHLIRASLVDCYFYQGKYVEAEQLLKRMAAAIWEKENGCDSAFSCSNQKALGWVSTKLGKFAEAEAHYLRVLAVEEKAGDAFAYDVWETLRYLGELHTKWRKYYKAELYYKRALALGEQKWSPDAPGAATTLEEYAVLLRKVGRIKEAEAMEARARKIRAER